MAGLIHAVNAGSQDCRHPVYINVGEWNVVYRTDLERGIEEVYNLEDALMAALHLNAFIRHADIVKMANIAQIVNMIAPIRHQARWAGLADDFLPVRVVQPALRGYRPGRALGRRHL